jgi:hypothetical protein
MGRGGKDRAGHRGGLGYEGHGARGSNDDRWDPLNAEDDPRRDLPDPAEDPPDPAHEDYVWPEVDEPDDD